MRRFNTKVTAITICTWNWVYFFYTNIIIKLRHLRIQNVYNVTFLDNSKVNMGNGLCAYGLNGKYTMNLRRERLPYFPFKPCIHFVTNLLQMLFFFIIPKNFFIFKYGICSNNINYFNSLFCVWSAYLRNVYVVILVMNNRWAWRCWNIAKNLWIT